MSWRASAYVKELVCAPNGKRISRSEKLLMLILADYYNDSQERAWPSLKLLAQEAMLSVRRTQELLRSLEGKGVLEITANVAPHGGSASNSYVFSGLRRGGAETSPPAETRTRGVRNGGGSPIYEQESEPRAHAAVQIFFEVFKILPPILAQEKIAKAVKDFIVWRRVIERLQLNGTPAKNVGTMLDVYAEQISKTSSDRLSDVPLV